MEENFKNNTKEFYQTFTSKLWGSPLPHLTNISFKNDLINWFWITYKTVNISTNILKNYLTLWTTVEQNDLPKSKISWLNSAGKRENARDNIKSHENNETYEKRQILIGCSTNIVSLGTRYWKSSKKSLPTDLGDRKYPRWMETSNHYTINETKQMSTTTEVYHSYLSYKKYFPSPSSIEQKLSMSTTQGVSSRIQKRMIMYRTDLSHQDLVKTKTPATDEKVIIIFVNFKRHTTL